MVRYDGTVRNSSNQVVQFIYGEDGMAGENIEDLKIELVKLDDKQMKQKYEMLGEGKGCKEKTLEDLLKKSVTESVLSEISLSPQAQLKV